MKTPLSRRIPVLPLFFALAFTLSWLLWLPYVLSRLSGTAPTWPYFHFLGSLGPALAGLGVAWALEGRASLKRLLCSVVRGKASGVAWSAAVLGPLLLLACGLLIAVGFGEGAPALERLLRVTEHPELPFALVLLAELVFYGLGEELGWRGFALPRMAQRSGWLGAALRLSLFWAAWHLPLLLVNDTYRSMNPALLLGWFISLVTGSLLTAWIYLRSEGSVLPVVVFHGLLDVVMVNQGVSPVALNAMGALVTVWGLWAARQLARAPRPSDSGEHLAAGTALALG